MYQRWRWILNVRREVQRLISECVDGRVKQMPHRRTSDESCAIDYVDEDASESSRTWRIPAQLPNCALCCCPFLATETTTTSPAYSLRSLAISANQEPCTSSSIMHQQINRSANSNVQTNNRLLIPSETIPSRCKFPHLLYFIYSF